MRYLYEMLKNESFIADTLTLFCVQVFL